MADRARLRDTGPDDTQPDGLAAFLAGAEYHILHVGEIPHDASESLIAMGCYYGPRLFAAVEAARKHHWPAYTPWGEVCGGCWTAGSSHPVWPCPPMVDLVNALMGETSGAV